MPARPAVGRRGQWRLDDTARRSRVTSRPRSATRPPAVSRDSSSRSRSALPSTRPRRATAAVMARSPSASAKPVDDPVTAFRRAVRSARLSAERSRGDFAFRPRSASVSSSSRSRSALPMLVTHRAQHLCALRRDAGSRVHVPDPHAVGVGRPAPVRLAIVGQEVLARLHHHVRSGPVRPRTLAGVVGACPGADLLGGDPCQPVQRALHREVSFYPRGKGRSARVAALVDLRMITAQERTKAPAGWQVCQPTGAFVPV